MKSLLKSLASTGISAKDKDDVLARLAFLDSHVDLMTVTPEAFMDITGSNPRAARKSKFFPKLQEVLGADNGMFRLCGYPNLRSSTGAQPSIVYAIDLMNTIHKPVDYEHSLTARMPVQKCASDAVSPVIRNVHRNLIRLDLHCDFPDWVVKQKKGTQSMRDVQRSFNSSQHNTDSTSIGSCLLDLNRAPPKPWSKVLANRKFKEYLTVAVGAEAFVQAARLVHTHKCNAEVNLSGLCMFVTNRASSCRRPEDLEVTVIDDANGPPCAIIFLKFDEEPPSILDIRPLQPSKTWKLCYSGGATSTIVIERNEYLDSSHGEAETRIQYQLYERPPSFPSTDPVYYVQESADSDNVCLALISHTMSRRELPDNTFIRGRGTYYDIQALIDSIRENNLEAEAVVRLYCLSGNDFNNSTNVAHIERLLQTFKKWGNQIGDLSSPSSIQSLFFLAFLSAATRESNIMEGMVRNTFMSPDWKKWARETIACGRPVKGTYDLLPQDSDIDLVFRRAVLFNCNAYWGRTLQRDLKDIPCNITFGYNEDGSLALYTAEAVKERKQILSSLNAQCRCGVKSMTDCCKNKRCSCVKANRKCDSRCNCPTMYCHNSVSSRKVADREINIENGTVSTVVESDAGNVRPLTNERGRGGDQVADDMALSRIMDDSVEPESVDGSAKSTENNSGNNSESAETSSSESLLSSPTDIPRLSPWDFEETLYGEMEQWDDEDVEE